jgi:hypothetical protein
MSKKILTEKEFAKIRVIRVIRVLLLPRSQHAHARP